MTDAKSYNQEKFDSAINQINFRATIENQREKIKESFLNNCIYPYNGGFFNLSVSFLSEIHYLKMTQTGKTIILDINLNPVEIDDISAFNTDIKNHYFESLIEYKNQLSDLTKSRFISTMTKLDQDVEE